MTDLSVYLKGKKTHGSVAVLRLMFLYLLSSLASKVGKTNIGDKFLLATGKFPLGSIPAFICLFSPLSHEFLIKKFLMTKVINFEEIHTNCAGIDVGSKAIFVSPDGREVVSFQTFTADYYKCCRYLQEKGVRSVAMEATGVYWMSLYSILEEHAIKVCLVHPRETQQVKGRKSDVKDAQWIQKLFSAGLLRESIVAEGKLKELRFLTRERMDLIGMGATYVNKMQKYMELMNIKLGNVITQIHGASGLRIIKAVLSGERDLDKLADLCHERILDRKREEVKKSLEGNYNKIYLALLAENMRLWEEHQSSIKRLEDEIGKLLERLNRGNRDMEVTSRSKPSRHHQPQIKNLHRIMVQMHGTDLTGISGINDSTMLRLMGEVGTDLSRFPSNKHFVSWLGLSPKNKQSGKMKKRVSVKSNNAGLIFRQSAQSLLASKNCAVGIFMRRLKSRKGAKVAVKAGARKIAIAYYDALTKGMEYVEAGAEKYMEQIKLNEIRLMNKLVFYSKFIH
jgi:transposase